MYFTTGLYNRGAISAFDNRFICVSAKKARMYQYNIKIYLKTKVKKQMMLWIDYMATRLLNDNTIFILTIFRPKSEYTELDEDECKYTCISIQ